MRLCIKRWSCERYFVMAHGLELKREMSGGLKWLGPVNFQEKGKEKFKKKERTHYGGKSGGE